MESSNDPVSIIIPAYNEENAIEGVILKVKDVMNESSYQYEIVVVDDGSRDETTAKAERTGARILRHRKNRGYGAALKTGIRAAKYDAIVIADADGTYPVDQIPEILDKLQSADMVVGARVTDNTDIPLVRRPAKWIVKRLSEYITGDRIPDLNSGLRGFRSKFVEQYFSVLPEKFSFTTTLTVAMLCDNYKITYVPIDYYKRSGKSKVVPWDFMNFVTLVLRLSMLFNPLKVFVPISSICFLLGGSKLLFDIGFAILRANKMPSTTITHPIVSATTLILLLFGLQILLLGMLSDGTARKIGQLMPSGYRSSWTEKVDEQHVKSRSVRKSHKISEESRGKSK